MILGGTLLVGSLWLFSWLGESLLTRPVIGPLVDKIIHSEGAAVFINPLFWVALSVILVLERWFPVDQSQPIFSAAFCQDALYFVLISLSRLTFLAAYTALLKAFYSRNLDFLTVDSAESWPFAARVIVAVSLSDFLGWFHHWVIHKVPLFWSFHTIHHSQPQINLFSDLRYHPLEYLVTQTIKTLPLLAFEATIPAIVAYHFIHQWFTKLYHGNIRADLGPLKYLLVTPQSHRIHHSFAPQHRDRNFGVMFSIWDRIFGTQYDGASGEYPLTGIDDPTFPNARSTAIGSLLKTLWQQLLYPFRQFRRTKT